MSSNESSEIHHPAFEIYRDHDGNKCENDDLGNGNIYPDQTLQIDDKTAPPPPYIVLVQGPPNVGKSLLIKSLYKYFTMDHMMDDIQGPITIITGKKARLQFVECPGDINGMVDAVKYADAVLLLVDASFGFEAETFEFLNLLQVHGFPKVMGVLTHLDEFKDETKLNETVKHLEDHFRTEIYQAATIYNLSGLDHNLYKMREVHKLAEDLMLQFRTASWRAAHPYLLVDRFEDVTPLEKVQKDANCSRNITLYGYLRGCNIKTGAKVHIAGVGDFCLAGVRSATDPFPLSSEMKNCLENESFRTGTYLRLEVHDVPIGMVENFDPSHPILVGGISFEEENAGYILARLKRHNWHMKLLKSENSITVSAGWRRYQTEPIYASESDNIQHQYLGCTPEHEHCLALFWGPPVPPLTRIAIVQSNKEAFRIRAKAVVLDPKHDVKIMKEIKLKGKPHKILKSRTALIKFSSDIDVAQFKGAPVRTRSGIWGKINEVVGEGIASCTFKKRIRLRDFFFMPVLNQVVAPRFFKLCDSSVPANKDSFKKEDPAQRRLVRRGVNFTDVYPSCFHSSTNHVAMLYNLYKSKNKGKFTVVVMPDGKSFLGRRKEYGEKPTRFGRLRRTGTTCITVKNDWGTYMCTEGSPHDKDLKIYDIGSVFTSVSGHTGWIMPIVEELRSTGKLETPESCALHALKRFQDSEYGLIAKEWDNDTPGLNIQKEACAMTFASKDDPRVIHVERDEFGMTCIHELYSATEVVPDDVGDYNVTFLCHGSGGQFASEILKKHVKKIEGGLPQDIGSQTHVILRAVLWACHRDSHSGGLIRVILIRNNSYLRLWKGRFGWMVRRPRFASWLMRERTMQMGVGWMKKYMRLPCRM